MALPAHASHGSWGVPHEGSTQGALTKREDKTAAPGRWPQRHILVCVWPGGGSLQYFTDSSYFALYKFFLALNDGDTEIGATFAVLYEEAVWSGGSEPPAQGTFSRASFCHLENGANRVTFQECTGQGVVGRRHWSRWQLWPCLLQNVRSVRGIVVSVDIS